MERLCAPSHGAFFVLPPTTFDRETPRDRCFTYTALVLRLRTELVPFNFPLHPPLLNFTQDRGHSMARSSPQIGTLTV